MQQQNHCHFLNNTVIFFSLPFAVSLITICFTKMGGEKQNLLGRRVSQVGIIELRPPPGTNRPILGWNSKQAQQLFLIIYKYIYIFFQSRKTSRILQKNTWKPTYKTNSPTVKEIKIFTRKEILTSYSNTTAMSPRASLQLSCGLSNPSLFPFRKSCLRLHTSDSE